MRIALDDQSTSAHEPSAARTIELVAYHDARLFWSQLTRVQKPPFYREPLKEKEDENENENGNGEKEGHTACTA